MQNKAVIGMYNRKGGVGKTFCTINLAAQFAMDGKRVLIIDGDSQINLTQFFLQEDLNVFQQDGTMKEDTPNIFSVLNGDTNAVNAIHHLSFTKKKRVDGKYRMVTCRIDLIPGSPDLDYIPVDQIDLIKKQLDKLEYDIIFIDFPPQNSMITMAYMYACTQILVPMELAKQASFSGYVDVMNRYMGVIQEYNLFSDTEVSVSPLSCFFNGVWLYKDDQKKMYEQSLQMKDDMGLFGTTIRFDYSSAQNCAAAHLPLCIACSSSPITADFKNLADEIAERYGL